MVLLTELDLYYPDLDDRLEGLTILHAGDLHTSGWRRREAILRRVMQTPAPGRERACDIMIFSGDMCHQLRLGNPFVEKNREDRPLPPGFSRHGFVMKPHWRESLEVTDRLLEGFDCPMGVFVVQGNHDCPEYIEGLRTRPVRVLNNEAVAVSAPGGASIQIAGCRGYGRAATDVVAAVRDLEPGRFTLAVSHFPEFSEPLELFGANLILAGHTHGGQVCLPGRRALKTHSRTGTRFVSGLTRIARGYQFTTRGLGTSMFPIRICCPPEIARIVLRRGEYDAWRIRESRAG